MAPQLIWIVLTAMGMGVAICKHGEQTTSNAWVSLISSALVAGLLWWGGFFGPMFR